MFFAFYILCSYFFFQRLYELVVRHFLACVSQPAVGAETTVEIDIAGEMFSASGRVILAVSFPLYILMPSPSTVWSQIL